jgi:hypothetical protein
MALSTRHLFARRLLWRVVAILAALLAVGRVLGAGAVLGIVEWTPMTVALLLLAVNAVRAARRRF